MPACPRLDGTVLPSAWSERPKLRNSAGLEGMMVSIWWVVAAFVLGCNAGLVVFALMSMAARHDE